MKEERMREQESKKEVNSDRDNYTFKLVQGFF